MTDVSGLSGAAVYLPGSPASDAAVSNLCGAAVYLPGATSFDAGVSNLSGAAIFLPKRLVYTGSEPRLPTNVEAGAVGGPMFKTTVLELSDGREQRNQDWSQALHSWDLGYGIQRAADLVHLITFFNARRGKLLPFRFKDWADYTADSQFATGDGTTRTFQLAKTYSSGGVSYRRLLRRIAAVDWILVDGSVAPFFLDFDTGLVTFDTAPASGAVLAFKGEFDVPVRFDQDNLNVTLEHLDAGTIPSITIREVRQ